MYVHISNFNHTPFPTQIKRCVSLLRLNRGAARRFYQLAGALLSPGEVARFILAVRSTLLRCIKDADAEAPPTDGRGKGRGKAKGTITTGKVKFFELVESILWISMYTVKVLIKDTPKEDKPPNKGQNVVYTLNAKLPSKEDNLSTKDNRLGPKRVHYLEVLCVFCSCRRLYR